MNRTQKKKCENYHWRWEDNFEDDDSNRPKVKIRKKNRQQVRHAIRVGDYDDLTKEDVDE